MNDEISSNTEFPDPWQTLPGTLERQVDTVRDDFAQALRDGDEPRIEDSLSKVPESAVPRLLLKLIIEELTFCHSTGKAVGTRQYLARFPNHQTIVESAFESAATIPTYDDSDRADHPPVDKQPEMPEKIGRYEVRGLLGSGSYGDVYKAEDPVLNRMVAIKVPRMDAFSSEHELSQFLDEARTAAGLRHPGIVAVYDVIQETDFVCAVQEYVDGQDLHAWLKSQPERPDVGRVVQLTIKIAEAVDYAHQQGLVHRDLKPANVLIDRQGTPRIADFGLAVHESAQHRHRGQRAGAPAYMSPEQVRGDAHHLDGRSDIWLWASSSTSCSSAADHSAERRCSTYSMKSNIVTQDHLDRSTPSCPRNSNASASSVWRRIREIAIHQLAILHAICSVG